MIKQATVHEINELLDGGGKCQVIDVREFSVPSLTLAAIASGAQGLFLETHPDPDHAPSDGPNMLKLDALGDLMKRAVDIWDRVRR